MRKHLSVVIALICAMVFFVIMAFIAGKNTKSSPANNTDVTEIGWRPMIGGIQEEPMSGVFYVTVSISGGTKDKNSYRQCFIKPQDILGDGKFWRENSKTGEPEVYVVSQTFQPSYQRFFFIMRNAKILRRDHK